MPTMVHPESGQTRIIPGRSRSAYEQRGWRLASTPGAAKAEQAVADIAAVDRPAINDPKADWVAYADKSGVDTDGLTKAEIIDTVGA